jgi:hypothetical protein
MSLDAAQKQLLRAISRKRSRAELKRLFAAIRAHDDRALFAALAPARKKAKRTGDPLVRDLDLALKPILAPAAEKAEMLIEHLAKKHRRKLASNAKGLADAARSCHAAKLSDEQILAGAKALVAHLAKLHGRETVV